MTKRDLLNYCESIKLPEGNLLELLLKAGFCNPNVLTQREVSFHVEHTIKLGKPKMQAYTEMGEKCKTAEITIIRYCENMSTKL